MDDNQFPEALPVEQPAREDAQRVAEETAAHQAEEGPHTKRASRSRRKKVAEEAIEQAIEQSAAETSEEPAEKKRYAPTPEPRGQDTIALTDKKDGPKAYLQRANSTKPKQMEIAFDEKPGEEVRQMLKDEGFTWNGETKVWEYPIEQERDVEWQRVMHAERVFKDAANYIRTQNGLAPVGMDGPGF